MCVSIVVLIYLFCNFLWNIFMCFGEKLCPCLCESESISSGIFFQIIVQFPL
jgi:hypothetical protein